MSRYHNGGTRGEGLIESIIYIAVLTAMLAVLTNLVVSIPRVSSSLKASRDTARSASIALETMTREVRAATAVVDASSTFGSSPGVLALIVALEAGGSTTTEFFVENNILKTRGNGIWSQPLLFSGTRVNSLIFNKITTGESTAIRITLTLETPNRTGTTTASFQTSVIMRPTYQD